MEVAGHLGNDSVLRTNGKNVHGRTRLPLLGVCVSVRYQRRQQHAVRRKGEVLQGGRLFILG